MKKRVDRVIDTVFIVKGHGSCGMTQFEVEDPDTCVMTLVPVNGVLLSRAEGNEMKLGVKTVFESSSPSYLSSFVNMAKKLRETREVYPQKFQDTSIRTRCGSRSKTKFKVTNQDFFGGTSGRKDEYEGIFMLEQDPLSRPKQESAFWDLVAASKDISSRKIVAEGEDGAGQAAPGEESLLTRNVNEYNYEKTTEVQRRIIELEAKQVEAKLPFNKGVLEEHFKDEPFMKEWTNLATQRRLFCESLNCGMNVIGFLKVFLGVDVTLLQNYYNYIAGWEHRNRRSAHDYFTQEEGALEKFIRDNPIDDEGEKTRKLLMILSEKRKIQVEMDMANRAAQGRSVTSGSEYKYDYQTVPSRYQTKNLRDLLQQLRIMYPRRKKLIIIETCRFTAEERDPYMSDNDGEIEDVGGAGARRNNKIKRKNTYNQKKKFIYKKTYKKIIYKKKIKSCKKIKK